MECWVEYLRERLILSSVLLCMLVPLHGRLLFAGQDCVAGHWLALVLAFSVGCWVVFKAKGQQQRLSRI